MNFENIGIMDEQFNSKNIENDEFTVNTEKSDYKNLIIKLKDISTTIALLEKIIFR